MNYQPWNTRRSLGVLAAKLPAENRFYAQRFKYNLTDTAEYFDFEKLGIRARKLAPFSMPLAPGQAIWKESQREYRFKPGYVKLTDHIDPLKPLRKMAGIDPNMIGEPTLTPMQRLDRMRIAIASTHLDAFGRTLEWMAARALIDGRITLTGPNYPTTLVDFARDPGHTIILTAGNRFGDAGVSIWDFIQARIDQMAQAEYGGAPQHIRMGGGVWEVLRKDAEFLAHLDNNIRDPRATIERGMSDGGLSYKVGEITVGGASGARIDLWVDNEWYEDAAGLKQRYLGNNEMLFLSSDDAIEGYECFGQIVDGDARYEAMRFFASEWEEGNFPKTKHMGLVSAPLMVPVNPNATLKATVLA